MRRDFFVINRNVEQRVKDGVALFASLTGFKVWPDLLVTELNDRMINFNHDTAHLVDQRGVLIDPSTKELKASSMAVPFRIGTSGTPKDYRFIAVAEDLLSFLPRRVPNRVCGDNVATAVAHELLHTCHVVHHGVQDTVVDWIITQDAQGRWNCLEILFDPVTNVPTGASGNVSRMDSPGVPHVYTQTGTLRVDLAAQGGKYSGDRECVMRYDNATAYIDPLQPDVRVDMSLDCTGVSLSTAKTGKTFNPCGPAAVGDCASQVEMRDR